MGFAMNVIGKPLEPRTLSRPFRSVLPEAKLPETLRLHDCRHFTATAMITDGTDPCTAPRKAADRMAAFAQPRAGEK